jgi:hypothetical protein
MQAKLLPLQVLQILVEAVEQEEMPMVAAAVQEL